MKVTSSWTIPPLPAVIRGYTREAGLRNLERELGSICRKLARQRAEGKKGSFTVDSAMVEKLLGAPRFIEDEKDKRLMPGMALGLAWTPAGGEVLTIECACMKGKGNLQLTGQLGDVMKESARIAMSYIRSRADSLGIDADFSDTQDIHIHVPAGAVPKDGPSAGVTLTSALISALSGRIVRADTCMTGEITLQGRVLPRGRHQGKDPGRCGTRAQACHHPQPERQGSGRGPQGTAEKDQGPPRAHL